MAGAPKSASGLRCPICGKPAKAALKPFCSERCRDEDLNRWLGGHYRIKTDEKPAERDVPEEPPEG
jgi:endogenous inhibitor of DNA gyrase (YacG/DUF329 family)